MTESPYFSNANRRFSEILSRVDHEPFSRTFGCGDRNYWGWKFVDFSGARFQEFLYSAAWMKTSKSANADWRDCGSLEQALSAGFGWWRKIQYADGSFDEAYPYERSFAATAFTLFYLSEAFALVRGSLECEGETLDAMARAANWLCRNEESHGMLSNHVAAAAAAMWNCAELLDSEVYRRRANQFIERILNRQSHEGWYEEYGGPDIGYQTHCSFYLARIWQRSRDSQLLGSLKSANAFLSHFIHPDHSVGGEYSSRGTKFYFPAAYEILWDECVSARSIAEFQKKGIAESKGVGIWQMDEYNLYPMLNNYLFAEDALRARQSKNLPVNLLPWQKEQEYVFEQAGLVVDSRSSHFAVFGLGSGGVVRVWNKRTRKLAFQNVGYAKKVGTQWLSTRALSKWTRIKNGWYVENNPVSINQMVFSPLLFLCFRSFNISLGRYPFFAKWIKRLLVRVLVSRKKTIKKTFSREIIWSADDVLTLRDEGKGVLRGSLLLDRFLPFHMGSARYIDEGEEINRPLPFDPIDSDANETMIKLSR